MMAKTKAYDGLCWEGHHEFKIWKGAPVTGTPMEYCTECGLLRLKRREASDGKKTDSE